MCSASSSTATTAPRSPARGGRSRAGVGRLCNHLRNQQIYIDNSPGDARRACTGGARAGLRHAVRRGSRQVLGVLRRGRRGRREHGEAGDRRRRATDGILRLGGVPGVVGRHLDAEDQVLAAARLRSAPTTAAAAAQARGRRRRHASRLAGLQRRAARRRVGGPRTSGRRWRRGGRGISSPCTRPGAACRPRSNVNYRTGGRTETSSSPRSAPTSSINVCTDKPAHIIVDVFGYFSTTAATWPGRNT